MAKSVGAPVKVPLHGVDRLGHVDVGGQAPRAGACLLHDPLGHVALGAGKRKQVMPTSFQAMPQ